MQDRVALLLHEQTYSALTTNQKAVIDGSGSGLNTAAPGGVAGDAFKMIGLWNQWLTQAGLATIGDYLEPWAIDETCWRAARVIRPDRYQMFRDACTLTMRQALEAYSDNPVDSSTAVSSTAYAKTLQSLRKYAVTYLKALEPPVYIPMDALDQAAQSAVHHVWNARHWTFKRREVVLSIDTSSNVTVSSGLGVGETMDELATLFLYYTDSSGDGLMIEWANADVMASQRARVNVSSARPQIFRTRGQGSARVWQFWPTPDTTYTVRAEVWIESPSNFSSATSTTVLDLFPGEFIPFIRRAMLAEALRMTGRAMGERMWSEVNQEIERTLVQFEEQGVPTQRTTVRDDNKDVYALGDSSGYLGGGV